MAKRAFIFISGIDPSKGSPRRSAQGKYRPLLESIETNLVKSMYRQITVSRLSGDMKIGSGLGLFFLSCTLVSIFTLFMKSVQENSEDLLAKIDSREKSTGNRYLII
jgi:hypothetical protein